MTKITDDSQKYSIGFTLIELLIVIAIAAILATLAGPFFIATTQRFRSLSESGTFAGDLQYARSEAIKQGLPVTVCASFDGSTCAATNSWHHGWIIFSDPAANQTVSPGTILRKQKSWVGTDTFIASSSVAAITYRRDGFRSMPSNSSGIITVTLHTSPANNNATQCITVSATGRQRTLSYGTGCI